MAPDDKNKDIIEVEAGKTEEIDTKPETTEAPEEAGSPQTGFSEVASTPQYKKIMIAGVVAIGLGALYYIFFGRPFSEEELKEKKDREIASQKEQLLKTSTPVTEAIDSSESVAPPKLPEPPPIAEPTPPAPPPPPIPLAPPTPSFNQNVPGAMAPTVSGIMKSDSGELERLKKLEAKRKATMIVVGGGGIMSQGTKKEDGGGDDKQAAEKKKDTSNFLGFGNGSLDGDTLAYTSAEQVKATKMGNTDNLIAQGKVINAVLETAINTDLPGMLRAIITRDVYAESGRNILIPKGSRVVGTYDSEIKDGQTRVSIIWERLIRPDGIDIAIASPGTDQLGRSGVSGKLDNKFWARIGSAILVSYVIPILANKFTKVNKDDKITTTTTTGAAGTTSTTESSFRAQQAKEASDKFTEVAKDAIEKTFSTKPTITVNQGTRVNIFVNKDLVFPSAYSISNMKVVK